MSIAVIVGAIVVGVVIGVAGMFFYFLASFSNWGP